MNALMPGILLRMARLDPFDLDAEPEPSDRQPAQSKEGVGARKGNALSVRMAHGRPNSLNALSNAGKAQASLMVYKAWQAIR